MFGILHHLRKFLLSALKRYSPGRLLQYLLALCRAVFSRCKPEFSGQDSSHEFIHKTLTLAEGKESPSEEGMINSVGRVISACCTPGQMEEGRAHGNEDPAQGGDGPARNVATSLPKDSDVVCIKINPRIKEGLCCMWTNSSSLFNMVTLLDHPGLIRRSLVRTQIKIKNSVYCTDVEKWRKFSETYTDDTKEVNLLATVLLAANMSFLAIQSIDNIGLSYLPQRFSYLSLLAALASIVMGAAVRSPRLFTNHGRFSFEAMILILGFPFECFLYSILFFLLAILVHCAKHKAVLQLVCTGILAMFLLCCLVVYWLITEPCNDIDSLHERFTTPAKERTATTS